MPTPLFVVDAFTGERFSGNPAAVCLLECEMSNTWMQSMAAEMNLSETAFLLPTSSDAWSLRWFTPKVEVDLCGHATLASAHVLFETHRVAADSEARFDTRSGRLICARHGNRIRMDFPADPVKSAAMPMHGLEQILAARPVFVGKAKQDLLVELGVAPQQLEALRPDMQALAQLPHRLVIVTCEGGGAPYDFVSRVFAPAVGVAEDPVTGAAHCALATYWAKRLNKNEFFAHQASARGGEMRVTLQGERVFLEGEAVTVVRGELV